MRKLLFATSMLTMSVSIATAADNGSISLTSNVPQSCSVSVSTLTVTVPNDGSVSETSPFTFVCNFTGNSAALTYDSQNDGVKRGTTGPVRAYDIITDVGADGDSSAAFTTSSLATTELTPVNNGVKFKLKSPTTVVGAGDYVDTLLVTIAP